jgi:hypothetical protein
VLGSGNSLTADAPQSFDSMPYQIVQGNSIVEQSAPINIHPYSLGSLKSSELLNENTLISCLIRYESGGDPEAIGDHGLAKNVLQFHEATFNLYAEKYGLDLDYNSAEDQIRLATEMLKRDPNNIYHWSTWRLCQK